MKRQWILIMAAMLYTGAASATPSTVFWTPCTSYIQPFGVPHLTYDSYLNRGAEFPTDLGLTVGLVPAKKFQAEAGFDAFLPGTDPWQFNFKVGTPEGALSEGAPGISVGMFGMGTEKNVNNYNVVHLEVGKTFKGLGTLAVGGYQGTTRDLMRSADGGRQDGGGMVAYYRTLEPLTDKIAVTADWMSGKNVFGAGGAGIYLWPTPSVDVIMGWVWFNDSDLNPYPNGLFTIQLDVDMDLKSYGPGVAGLRNRINLRGLAAH